MPLQAQQRELLIKLKQYREEHNLSHQRIVDLVAAHAEKHGTDDYVSLSTVKRIFREGSEDEANFNYDLTIRPIAVALLGADEVNTSDHDKDLSMSLLRYKNEKIRLLQQQLEDEKASAERRISFLREQIAIKDSYLQEKDRLLSLLIETLIRNKKQDIL